MTICKLNITSTRIGFQNKFNFVNASIPTVDLNKNKSIKVLSLFSGCGGLDLGVVGGFKFRGKEYSKNKFSISFSNDIDKDATSVYNENFKYFKHKITEKDIALLEHSEVPDFDFLIGGFPCQPFSSAGLRKGVDDNRGTLFENAIEMFNASIEKGRKPIGFMFENVRGIMSSKMPDGTTVPDEIVKRMEFLGYNTNYKLVKASNYGVPSNRYRLFIVGFRKEYGYFDFDLMDEVVAEYNIPNAKNSPYDLYLGSVLSDIPEDAPQKNDYWRYSPAGQKMVESIGLCIDGEKQLEKFKEQKPLSEISETISQGRSWKNMPYEDMTPRFKKIWDDPKKYRAPNFYRRFALGEINGTITASAQPENCGITHPFKHRRFTVREIARIQSFPDDFKFPYTTVANAYKVIGNAVPPVLGWVFAKSVEKFLKIN